jgi:hypothetical protein
MIEDLETEFDKALTQEETFDTEILNQVRQQKLTQT